MFSAMAPSGAVAYSGLQPQERGATMSGKIFVATGATVVAGITLGFGLGGAYASGKDKAPKPQKGTIWAVVNSDATLERQSKDITGAVHVATGQYRVFAKGDVRNCAYEATAGDA